MCNHVDHSRRQHRIGEKLCPFGKLEIRRYHHAPFLVSCRQGVEQEFRFRLILCKGHVGELVHDQKVHGLQRFHKPPQDLVLCCFGKFSRQGRSLGEADRVSILTQTASQPYGQVGLKACSLGMNVLFKNATTLSTELTEAKDSYLLDKLEKRIRQTDLLILDEMSYVSFDRFQSEMVFKVVSDRSELGSVIVTTNLLFSQWTELFQNTAMVAALVDRLTFKSFVLDMNGDSFRLDQSLKS